MSDKCDADVFSKGESVCVVDVPKEAAKNICRNLSAVTGCKIDWHYIGGRVHIKALAASAVERQDGSALMKIAADLANRHPLRQLYLICEHQVRINTDSLHEHLDKCGDLLAGIALDIRRAITSPPAPVSVMLPDVDVLAQIIRTVDGNNSLGAGALAERIIDKVKELNQ